MLFLGKGFSDVAVVTNTDFPPSLLSVLSLVLHILAQEDVVCIYVQNLFAFAYTLFLKLFKKF